MKQSSKEYESTYKKVGRDIIISSTMMQSGFTRLLKVEDELLELLAESLDENCNSNLPENDELVHMANESSKSLESIKIIESRLNDGISIGKELFESKKFK